MEILGLQKLTLLDYPEKMAATVFLGGCNFRCPFCHNGNLVVGEGERFSKEEIVSFLKKRMGILDGVCITGGEPLLNGDIFELLEEIKSIGYLVKLDTNGSRPQMLKQAVERNLVDYVAMDIKNSQKLYPQTVGIENFDISPILESVEFLKSGMVDYEFRTTVVAELHSKESIEEMAEWIKGAKQHFLQGFVDSPNVIKKGLSPFSEEKMKEFADILKNYVQKAEIRGI